MNLSKLAQKIKEIPGIQNVSLWTRVENKQRIYIEIKKYNRHRCWDLGAGRSVIVHGDGRMNWSGQWAGAMTRDWHTKNKTWARIRSAVDSELDETEQEIAHG